MLIDPGEAVILLPAATRYEIPGGITQTSTERRIMFSPEIEGAGSARPDRNGRSSRTWLPGSGRTAPDWSGSAELQAIREEIS